MSEIIRDEEIHQLELIRMIILVPGLTMSLFFVWIFSMNLSYSFIFGVFYFLKLTSDLQIFLQMPKYFDDKHIFPFHNTFKLFELVKNYMIENAENNKTILIMNQVILLYFGFTFITFFGDNILLIICKSFIKQNL